MNKEHLLYVSYAKKYIYKIPIYITAHILPKSICFLYLPNVSLLFFCKYFLNIYSLYIKIWDQLFPQSLQQITKSFLLSLQQITKSLWLKITSIYYLSISVGWKSRHCIAQLLLCTGFHRATSRCQQDCSFTEGLVMNPHPNLFRFGRLCNICVVLHFITFLKCLTVENGWILLSASEIIHYTLMY